MHGRFRFKVSGRGQTASQFSEGRSTEMIHSHILDMIVNSQLLDTCQYTVDQYGELAMDLATALLGIIILSSTMLSREIALYTGHVPLVGQCAAVPTFSPLAQILLSPF